jgi:hypothetical protein
LELIEGATGESLTKIQEEIDSFLNEKPSEEKKEEKKDDSNPIFALFGVYNQKSKKKDKPKEKKEEKIISDDWVEKYLRKKSEDDGGEKAFLVYDIYKKAHGMSSYT